MSANNVPGTLIEEYFGYRSQYIRLGQQFDSEVVKRVILDSWMETHGLLNHERPKELDLFPAEVIPASEAFARGIRMDDAEAKAEADAAVALGLRATAEASGSETEVALLRAQLASQAEKLARFAEWEAEEARKAAVPTADWERKEIIAWAGEKGIDAVTGKAPLSKAALVEFVLGESKAKAELELEAEAAA